MDGQPQIADLLAEELAAAKQRMTELEDQLFSLRAQALTDRGDLLLLEPPTRPDGARKLADAAAKASGGLAADISTEVGPTFVRVGSGKEYAAIHQLGGEAGRGRKVHIPARPFLPFTGEPDSGSGKLQPEAEEAILDIVLGHLKRAAGV